MRWMKLSSFDQQVDASNNFADSASESCSRAVRRFRLFDLMVTSVPWLWRPIHLRPGSFETTTFETTFIWNLFIRDHGPLRPVHPVHLRPQSRETFIWDHIHLRSHSCYVTLMWSCFDLLCITFLCTYHFFAGDLKFCKIAPSASRVTHAGLQMHPHFKT